MHGLRKTYPLHSSYHAVTSGAMPYLFSITDYFIYEKMNTNDFKVLHKVHFSTVPEMVTSSLRESILCGELQRKTQLKQNELASHFNVSMSALREALKNLEAEGLVKFYPNRGAEVTELSPEEVQEISEIRIFLETGALELAIPNFTQNDAQTAQEILQQAAGESSNAKWDELNWQFHNTLYQPSKRLRLLQQIKMLYNNVSRYMRLYFSTEDCQIVSASDHQCLLDACVQKNVKTAQKILRTHISNTSAALVRHLQSGDERPRSGRE